MSETTITVIENPRSGGELRARRTCWSKSDVKKIIDGRTPRIRKATAKSSEVRRITDGINATAARNDLISAYLMLATSRTKGDHALVSDFVANIDDNDPSLLDVWRDVRNAVPFACDVLDHARIVLAHVPNALSEAKRSHRIDGHIDVLDGDYFRVVHTYEPRTPLLGDEFTVEIDGKDVVAVVIGFETHPAVSAEAKAAFPEAVSRVATLGKIVRDYEIRLPGGGLAGRHAREDRARL